MIKDIKNKQCLVIKFGTATLTDPNGKINQSQIENFSSQISELTKQYNVILVSSGAVGTGKVFMQNFSGSIEDRKVAASIGNPILIQNYSICFNKHDIQVAQCLLERKHFSNRNEFLQLRNTIYSIWENKVLPIANENDVVSDLELKFSDNDQLATLLAISFNAKKMLIGSSVNGLLNNENQTIPFVEQINSDILAFVKPEKSNLGLGGMTSKLTHAKLACSLGVETIIFDAKQENAIIKAEKNKIGTTFKAKDIQLSAGQKWIGSAGIPIGKITIDKGAENAILLRKSLLAVGIINIKNNFDSGEVIEILNENQELIAVAKSKIQSSDIELNKKNIEIANANEIILI